MEMTIICHPAPSEGSLPIDKRSLASLGMTRQRAKAYPSEGPTHRRVGSEHDDAFVAARDLDPFGRVERPGLQGHAILVDREAVEARPVQGGEGFELVESPLFREDLGIDRHRDRRIEDAGAAAGALLRIGRVGRRIGAEEERRMTGGGGAPQSETMLLALGDRQAVEVRTDAALEDRIAI